ncbi:MAG: hypothetical protein KBB55_02325 [Candidatus Buchananbacteria bacterium]|nr:hypothetical protein [Candidatus Buchananbacteria bacterium]
MLQSRPEKPVSKSSFTNSITMQDDLATTIERKNHPKVKSPLKRLAGGRSNIQRRLAEVYTTSDGLIPDLTKLENETLPWWQRAITLVAIFAILAGVAGAGAFIVWKNLQGDSFTNQRVALKIEPALTVSSAQPAIYVVTITNHEEVDLYNVKLDLRYPQHFEFQQASVPPSDDTGRTWNFSVLNPGETKQIQITGRLLAPLGSNQVINGTLSYKPANLNGNFQQEGRSEFVINSSPLTLAIESPQHSSPTDPVSYTIKYKNTGKEDLRDLRLEVDIPQGFAPTKMIPDPEGGTTRWKLPELKAGTEGSVIIQGAFTRADVGNQDLAARLLIGRDGEYMIQAQAGSATAIVKEALSLQLIANGSAEDQNVGFGDIVLYTAVVKNNSSEPLENIQLSAIIDSQIVDWGSLRDTKGGVRSGSKVTWTGAQIPQLKKLDPGAEAQLSWQLRVLDAETARETATKFSIENHLEARVGTDTTQAAVKGRTLTLAVNSDVTLSALGRYYDATGLPLGSGPIQPQANEVSSYNIQIQLANNLHDLKDVKITAALPRAVTWSSKEAHTTGTVSYNPGNNTVTWSLPLVSRTAKTATASFNVNIKPTTDDVGRVLLLTNAITLTATDSETGATINKSLNAITTAFNDPTLGQLTGIVE